MDEFVSVLQPIESAKGLPNSCYTDPVMFEIETKQIFASDWAAIGFGFEWRQIFCNHGLSNPSFS